MIADRTFVSTSQAVPFENDQIPFDDNLSDKLFHSCNANIQCCKTIRLAFAIKSMILTTSRHICSR